MTGLPLVCQVGLVVAEEMGRLDVNIGDDKGGLPPTSLLLTISKYSGCQLDTVQVCQEGCQT